MASFSGAVRDMVGMEWCDLRHDEAVRLCGEVNWLIDGLGGERFPAIDDEEFGPPQPTPDSRLLRSWFDRCFDSEQRPQSDQD